MVTDDAGWSQMLSDASRWYQMCSYGHFEKGIRNKSADKGFLRVRYASPVDRDWCEMIDFIFHKFNHDVYK